MAAVHPPVVPVEKELIGRAARPPQPVRGRRTRRLRWGALALLVLLTAAAIVLDVFALTGASPSPSFRLLTGIALAISAVLLVAAVVAVFLELRQGRLRRPSLLLVTALVAAVAAGGTSGFAAVKGPACMQRTLGGADLRGCDFTGRNLAGRDLSNTNLAGVALSGADLAGADLEGATLAGANLSGANLSDARLARADLSKASLAHATLARAQLGKATLNGADLSSAGLQNADLTDASAENATLTEAVATDATLDGIVLAGAVMSRADLSTTSMQGAALDGATLDGAILRGADLTIATLDGANLSGADLTGATLAGAALKVARLTSAKLDDADATNAALDGAILDHTSLAKATLTGATLTGARLTAVTLDGAQLTGITGLTDAMLSSGLGVAQNELGRTLAVRKLVLETPDALQLALRPACSGKSVPGAGTSGAGASFHPMVVFGAQTPAGQSWMPPALRFAELVACVDSSTSRSIQSCEYSIIGSGEAALPIDRMQYSRHFRVINPATGAVVLDQTLQGSAPEACPTTAPASQREVSGSSPSDGDVTTVLARLVGSAPAA